MTVCIIVLKAVIMISLTSAIVEPMSFLKVNSKISDNILIHNSTCMNASKTEIKKLALHVIYIQYVQCTNITKKDITFLYHCI